MYKLFTNLIILFSLNSVLADDIDSLFDSNQKTTTFNFTNDAKSLNEDLKNNLEETSQQQRKILKKLFAFDVEYSLSMAQGYCYSIKNKDGLNGCMSGINLAKEDISMAQSYCYSIKDKDGLNGCMSGIFLAKENISMAQSYCYSIKDKDGLNDCMSGIFLAKENISMAQSYCYSIKDKDGLNGCMSGIFLAKENISMAQSYCYSIKDEDGLNGCMSGVNITGFFLKKEKEENEYQTRRINNLDNNINQTKEELSKDQQEALEMIKELEANPELLKDPETKILYQQLKGSLE